MTLKDQVVKMFYLIEEVSTGISLKKRMPLLESRTMTSKIQDAQTIAAAHKKLMKLGKCSR